MSFTSENVAELDLLLLFDLSTLQAGIKVHKTATPSAAAAALGLFEKGFITQEDGGYLTSLGITAAEHAQSLFAELNAPCHEIAQTGT
ncbi:MAG: TIGR02647 family protein [Gammaproteobacteria bacterium]|nr:TIGR02647 family protein [Gammaproteobacteria bacterium]PCH64083.1 MAG: TIGR02647 family protein [Gammaproteobacteria bacterium]